MKKLSIFLILIGVSISCQDQIISESSSEKVKPAFTMYELPEGATLMEEMYAYNMQLREKVINGKVLDEMPAKFNKRPMVALTGPSNRDECYLTKANEFLKCQEAIYTAEDPKQAFNQMVSSCIE